MNKVPLALAGLCFIGWRGLTKMQGMMGTAEWEGRVKTRERRCSRWGEERERNQWQSA